MPGRGLETDSHVSLNIIYNRGIAGQGKVGFQ